MLCRMLSLTALLSCLALMSAAEAGSTLYREFEHEATIMAKVGNHPNVVQFVGAVTSDFRISDENPLAVDEMLWVESAAQESIAGPGGPDGLQSVQFELFNLGKLPSLHSEGIVHRDIAARNFLITTDSGSYASGDGAVFLFGNDGGTRLQSGNVGPIRWMAPESLRLVSTDPSAGADDYIDLLPGSFLLGTYTVPEPSSVVLVTVGAMLLGAISATKRRGIVLA